MFDAATAQLIREAPAVPGIDPALLPQRLTQDYVELASLRMQVANDAAQASARVRLADLSQISAVYEAIVDRGATGSARQAAAFVAATAHQIHARFLERAPGDRLVLTATAIDPSIAAPILFLIAEQSPDAREAGARILGLDGGDLVRSALVESIGDLAAERFEEILRRAERLPDLGSARAPNLETQAMLALYGLCWRGLTQLVCQLLGRALPPSRFLALDTPRATFERVVELATEQLTLPDVGNLLSTHAGPRHLARLLLLMLDGFEGAGIVNLPAPQGSDPNFWREWVLHRSRTKPVLWRNHRKALRTGFHIPGQSAVIVLPTGAGKTTLSEIKIAATLAVGQKVVFLVPTLALVDQLRDDLAEAFPEALTATTPSVNSDLTVLAGGIELEQLEIMTPERCLAILSFAPQVFVEVGLIVFDECHLLSRQGGGSRSVDAMLCLLQAVNRAPNADVLLLSAMLTNADELGGWVESLIGKRCHSISDVWKPSRQARGVVVYDQREILAATALLPPWRRAVAIARAAKRKVPRKPPTFAVPFALFGLQHNWHPNAPQDIRLVQLLSDPVRLSIAQEGNWLTPNANKVAAAIAARAVAVGLKTIVFVQNAGHAPSTAEALSKQVPAPAALSEQEQSLWDEIQAELGGAEHSLVSPQRGALPHNGDMLSFERRFAERRFRRSDGASAIVASPTLAQGMNLPAQLAILAGDKRSDEDGRYQLAAHEILNAAGRAGRAGYLANGLVLLIPEPNATFDRRGPESAGFDKLRQILPPSDTCLEIIDPLTDLLDRIQAGDIESRDTRYLLSRLSAGQAEGTAPDAAAELIDRSFYAFKARRANEQARVNAAIVAVRHAVQGMDEEGDQWLAQIAAFTGQLSQPLVAARNRLLDDLANLPHDLIGWTDWFVDWLRDDPESRHAVIDNDGILLQVVRGKKTGGPPTPDEFELLKAGLRLWLRGAPFREIEIALGVQAADVGHCSRARDLVLKFASRNCYIVVAAISAIAKRVVADAGIVLPNPVVLETLPVALRIGVDLPDKAAFLQLNPHLRSRVLLHREFGRTLGRLGPIVAANYIELLRHLRNVIDFLK